MKSTGYSTKVGKTTVKLLACLLVWYLWRNFLDEFTDNCLVVFDQSSCPVLLAWCCLLHIASWYYLLSISDIQVFQMIKGWKAKISCFCSCFLFNPMRLECLRIRKAALFFPSHRLKKYRNLHPQHFRNGAETW